MRTAILSITLSLAALGLAGFATVRTFSDDSPGAPPVASNPVPGWSEAECAAANDGIGLMELRCIGQGEGCEPYTTLRMAINENCP
jgi:hypothetical protein